MNRNTQEQKNSQAIWTTLVRSYDNVLRNWSVYQGLIEKVLLHLQHTDLILDVGCGTGNIALSLAQIGKTVHAIDSNPAMVQLARKRLQQQRGMDVALAKRVVIYEADGLRLPYSNPMFDALVSINVITFVTDPKRLLAESLRVLKPGGKLVLSGFLPDPDPLALYRHSEREFEKKGIMESIREDLENFLRCAQTLGTDAVRNTYRCREIHSLVSRLGSVRVLELTDQVYLNQCFLVVLEKC